MKSHSRMGMAARMAVAVLLAAPLLMCAQATRFMGTVTAINGDTLTVQPTQGDARQVQVPSTAELKRIEPGQTNLSTAVAMQFSELAINDRVLVWLDPEATAGTPQAKRLVAIKEQDLAKRQEQQTEDWQKRGVGGLVKSVNGAAGTIVLTTGAGPAKKTLTIHVTKSTVLKRYAPASVSYAQAQAAPIGAIHAGDQLMARGDKNADGTEMTAEEAVSGTFLNIAGLIQAVDPAHSTLTVKDLATKKPVTIHIPADAQMRELPDKAAQFLAIRLKGSTGAASRQGGRGAGASNGAASGSGWSQRGGGHSGMDSQQMLSRAPAIHLTDLQKGKAVMLVATQSGAEVTAITLLSGVEPLLESPEASRDLLANWSMGTSAPEGAGGVD